MRKAKDHMGPREGGFHGSRVISRHLKLSAFSASVFIMAIL